MKLVHVVEDYWSEVRRGGGARYPYELMRALDGIEAVEAQSIVQVASNGDAATAEGSTVHPARGLCENDWLLVHNVDSTAMDYAFRVRDQRGLRIACFDHGGGSGMRRRIQRRDRLRAVNWIFAVSAFSASALRAPEDKVEVVFGGGDHILGTAAGPELPPSDFVFVGRLLPHKGVSDLLDALPADATLRIIGPSSSAETDYGRKLLHRCSLMDGVDVVLDGGDDVVRASMEASRYLLLPTLKRLGWRSLRRPELLGLVVLEAAALGKHAIVSDAGALPEIATRIGSTVVSAGDREAWSRALLDALEAPERCAVLSDEFTWRHVAMSVARRLRALGKKS